MNASALATHTQNFPVVSIDEAQTPQADLATSLTTSAKLQVRGPKQGTE